jgi:hypothetical protein
MWTTSPSFATSALHRDRLHAGLAHVGRDRFGGLAIADVVEAHGVARARGEPRRRGADAAAGARDDRDPLRHRVAAPAAKAA